MESAPVHRRHVLMGFLITLVWAVFGTPRVSASCVDPLAGTARNLRPLLRSNGARFAGFPLVEVGGVLLSEEEVEHARHVIALDKQLGSA